MFCTSKVAYPIVRQLEKITVKKAQANLVKCAKNKCWVPTYGKPGTVKISFIKLAQNSVKGL